MTHNGPPDENFGFYVASSDRDVLAQVSDLLRKKGCLGFADTAGRMHYVVDGRKGSAFAAKNILDSAGYFIRLESERRNLVDPVLEKAVRQILNKEKIPPHLKGYRYLRMMLVYSIRENADPWPVSKTLYPVAAGYFHTTPKKIERDIRYCLRQADEPVRGMTNSAAIIHLRDVAVRHAESMAGITDDGMTGGEILRPKLPPS